MTTADMGFRAAPDIVAALAGRVRAGDYGYERVTDEFYDAVAGWCESQHGWTPDRDWRTSIKRAWWRTRCTGTSRWHRERTTRRLSLPRSLTGGVVMLMSPSKTFSEPGIQEALALAPDPLIRRLVGNGFSATHIATSPASRPSREPSSATRRERGDTRRRGGVHMGERQACCCRRAAGTAATAPTSSEWPSPVRAPSLTTRWNG